MQTIQVRSDADGPWASVSLLPGEREGWVEVEDGGEARWVRLEDVHPADRVALAFERQARQRYQWVPKDDLG
ncbi:hypothetical protein EKD04_020610 [Chloroflexales bacterium ZM16-3]|nr:hypothetical protein [Chloroflexales bacterium ZM16-3]